MKIRKILKKEGSISIVENCEWADTYGSRLRGWMFRDQPSSDAGIFIVPCREIHLWFVRFPIDAIFLSPVSESTWKIEKISESLPPWKIFPVGCSRAKATLELVGGQARLKGLKEGDLLCIV